MAEADFAGNIYPPECRDLSAYHPPVVGTHLRHTRTGFDTYGLWTPLGGPQGTIYIDSSLTGWMREDVLRHELTHACMYVLHGDPHWHP